MVSTPVLYITGSHNNAALLGSSEKGKAAAFYLWPYLSKRKYELSESLGRGVNFCATKIGHVGRVI
jgi:hypothetical protein